MKNKVILGLLIAVCGLFLLTGCGGGSSDKLVCTMKESGLEIKMTISFDGDGKANDVSASFDAPSAEQAEQMIENFKEAGVEAKLSGKTITINDFSKISDVSQIMGKTKAELEKEAKDDGLDCK